jgi:RNA polymerase sigma factor (sigma-70 family)
MQQINWHEIYSNFSPKLLGICRRYIKDMATAEDIVHDSFIVAIQKQNDLKNEDALKGWLSKIVINRAINHLKTDKKNNNTSSENFEFIDETTEMNTLNLTNKATILTADFTHTDLLEAIDSLSENHKSVFNLYIVDAFSHAEISELLTISVGTSKSSLSRARKNVQQFLIDKLKTSKTEEKKKRGIVFLFFLGFGNQLFANYYRNSFSDFEIAPKKDFNSEREVQPVALVQPKKSTSVFNFLKVGIGAIVLILLVLFLQKELKTPVSTIQKPIEKEMLLSKPIEIDSTKTLDKIDEKAIFEKEKPVLLKNSQKIKAKIITPTLMKLKDTITEPEAPKVVVIKKQIIKKDTIYVEKE